MNDNELRIKGRIELLEALKLWEKGYREGAEQHWKKSWEYYDAQAVLNCQQSRN
jgi:hypothetical protein